MRSSGMGEEGNPFFRLGRGAGRNAKAEGPEGEQTSKSPTRVVCREKHDRGLSP